MELWFGHADGQRKTHQSPFSLQDLAGKALLTPIRKEVEWQFKCFIEWKYQKYLGYQELCRQNQRKSRRGSKKVRWEEMNLRQLYQSA